MKYGRMTMTGIIYDIKKFSIHDEPGIRTTVFLKGCNLKCIWCHNPESQYNSLDISFNAELCNNCMKCIPSCILQCHEDNQGIHYFKRENCSSCGVCANQCKTKALQVIGNRLSVSDIMIKVIEDMPFYERSGGGLTISGGEPTLQLEFVKNILRSAKDNKIHTCLDTCGFCHFENLIQIIGDVDIFLYDLKETNSEIHEEVTGVPNEKIIDNLYKLDSIGGKIILRCPIIPGINNRDNYFGKIANIANDLNNILEINIIPYHPFGRSKYGKLAKSYQMCDLDQPDNATVNLWIEKVRTQTKVKVKRA